MCPSPPNIEEEKYVPLQISLAETPECWNWQFRQDKIFADNFSYYRKFSDVCRRSYNICRYICMSYIHLKGNYMNKVSSLCTPQGKQSENLQNIYVKYFSMPAHSGFSA